MARKKLPPPRVEKAEAAPSVRPKPLDDVIMAADTRAPASSAATRGRPDTRGKTRTRRDGTEVERVHAWLPVDMVHWLKRWALDNKYDISDVIELALGDFKKGGASARKR